MLSASKAVGLAGSAQTLLTQALTTTCGACCSLQRGISVLSWGRNTEQQCGIEGDVPLLSQPTTVLELHQQPVTSISAGWNNSAAIVGSDVFVWGGGSCGKLGLGSGRQAGHPSRVEAFVGRSAIKAVSLGLNHTLFWDSAGALWACGENKEGQCGLGTPLAELAHQHRQAFDALMRRVEVMLEQPDYSSSEGRQLRAAAAAVSGAAAPHIAHGWGTLEGSSWGRGSAAAASGQQGFGASDEPRFSGSSSSGSGRRRSWLSMPQELGAGGAWRGGGMTAGVGFDSVSPWGSFGGVDLDQQMRALRMQPGQVHTPVRVGGEGLGPLLLSGAAAAEQESSSLAGMFPSSSGSDSSTSDSSEGSSGPFEQVVSAAASRHFSVAATASGEVWTWGACYNGGLGSGEGITWQSSATRVSAPISAAIASRGGAVAVAAGSTFAAALTASGEVVTWGRLFHKSSSSSRRAWSEPATGVTALHHSCSRGAACDSRDDAEHDTSSSSSSSGGGGQVGSSFSVVQLPPGVRVTHIAAGQQHLLLSDGERVWAVGRWLDGSGKEAGCAPAAAPMQLLALPDSGVVQLAAGMHSSACVDGSGQLWMWGRLLDRTAGEAVAAVEAGGAASPEAVRQLGRVDWGWAGFGGPQPQRVEGVAGVKDVALGGWHALVLTA